MTRPLCFVLMPFGKKADSSGLMVDFDAVYRDLIAPAIEKAELEPFRADEDLTGGIMRKQMFERLILCEYAVADLTTASANVFYELGARHAVRPGSTVLLFAEGVSLPFDVAPLCAMPYQLTTEGVPANVDEVREAMTRRLTEARAGMSETRFVDSPLYQLLEDFPEVNHTKTDVFRDRVRYSTEMKRRLAEGRKSGAEALAAIEEELSPVEDQESAVVIDLLLSYRAVSAWNKMIELVNKMARPLAATMLVQEQLGLALNRAGESERAEQVLKDLLDRRGASSETYAILGRVYKDRWEAATKNGEQSRARGLLDQAIKTYQRGFETDWRDAYPGINAVTLMELSDPPDPQREKLIPVVTYAVERRIAAGEPDYWDLATILELAVLAKNETAAVKALGDALALAREPWERETTARTLRLIRAAREQRNESADWALNIERELEAGAE
jgi:tetratricopeptide (TPR) repeat protein